LGSRLILYSFRIASLLLKRPLTAASFTGSRPRVNLLAFPALCVFNLFLTSFVTPQ
jgi:hypothetical protein